jgi:ketosteroid isomerase-like protein
MTTGEVVLRFHEAFNRQDMAALRAMLTDDCVFENTYPPPDGARHQGQEAVCRAFADFFAASPNAHFEIEALFSGEDQAVLRWLYRWAGESPGHVRGVDIFRVEDGKIAEKLSYVKG